MIGSKRQIEIDKIIKVDAEQILKHYVFDVEYIDSLAKTATMDHVLRSQIPNGLKNKEEIEFYILFLSDAVATEMTRFMRKETGKYFREMFKSRRLHDTDC